MASGFRALRAACPMQLLHCHVGFEPAPEVRADLARIETLWSHARKLSGSGSGWLFGDYCVADAFYTPVAARIVGYDLPVSPGARAYCDALLGDASMRRWREQALDVTYDPFPYALDLPNRPWPDYG